MKKFQLVFVLQWMFSYCVFSQDKISVRIDSLLNSFTKPNEPGGAVLIAKNNHIIFSKGYGIADINTKEAITANTSFNLGSISKTFVSNAILILQQRHQLSIEDNLLKYFPEFKNKAIAQKVQIKHLLSHVSGLPDCREVSKNTSFYLTADDAQNFAPIQKTDTLVFEPGSKYEYSNPAFNGLALIIEKVTKMKWQDFVKKEIFEKAGMVQSDITDGVHPETGVSHGYENDNGVYKELDYGEEPTFCASGNGGVWSSVNDLYKYYQALMKPAFLNKEIISNSMQVKNFSNWANTAKPFIGYSWFITKTFDGQHRIGHTGSQGGFRTNFQFVPGKNIFVTMLFNTPQEVDAIMTKIEMILKEEKFL
jgi:CubicO group peptidase (beta-lactamase class C family)